MALEGSWQSMIGAIGFAKLKVPASSSEGVRIKGIVDYSQCKEILMKIQLLNVLPMKECL